MSTQTSINFTPVQISKISTRPTAVSHDLTGTMELIGAPMNFARNVEIFGEGEPADYLYKVLSGTVRTYRVLCDGRRQIGAFYFAGDIFGLEAGSDHQFSAEAISDAQVLVIKRSALVGLANRDGEVARQLWSFTARELQRAQDHVLLLIKNAQQRVATFLLEMAERSAESGAFELPMSRQDIADYLGLTIETVSRALTQLEIEATIALPTSRRVVLRSREALNQLSA
jgi:CRP/FNR family transcriptional regulator, nitrogen fixation regulation protein